MKYTPIIGTLGYVLSTDKTHVLLIHRNAKRHDDHLGKYNGLGGKMHKDEDVYTAMRREILEEAGIEATKMSLRGTINWTGFGPKLESWLGFIFLIEAFTGTPLKKCEEGDLEWVPLNNLHKLPMWEGDKYFLPLLFDQYPKPFHGFMPYDNDKPLSWTFVRE